MTLLPMVTEHISYEARQGAMGRVNMYRPMWHSLTCICEDCLASDLIAYQGFRMKDRHLQPRPLQLATEEVA